MTKDIEQRQNEAEICMAEIKKDISFIKDEMGELKTTMKDFIEKSESKFANKWVENTVIGIGSALFIAILIAILNFL